MKLPGKSIYKLILSRYDSYLMLNAFWPCKFIVLDLEKCSWVLPVPSDLKWPRHAACKQAISAELEVPHILFDSIIALIMLMVRRRDWKVLLDVASYWPHQLPGVDASRQLLIRVTEVKPTAQPAHTSFDLPSRCQRRLVISVLTFFPSLSCQKLQSTIWQ